MGRQILERVLNTGFSYKFTIATILSWCIFISLLTGVTIGDTQYNPEVTYNEYEVTILTDDLNEPSSVYDYNKLNTTQQEHIDPLLKGESTVRTNINESQPLPTHDFIVTKNENQYVIEHSRTPNAPPVFMAMFWLSLSTAIAMPITGLLNWFIIIDSN